MQKASERKTSQTMRSCSVHTARVANNVDNDYLCIGMQSGN